MKGKNTGKNDSALEQVIIVDRKNRAAGSAPRRLMRRDRLIHRATYIIVRNPEHAILVQKRTLHKDIYPGYYEMAAGGVVRLGESYEQSAMRELEEETGISGISLRTLFDFYFEDSSNRVWGRVFSCVWEGPLKFQEEEVECGKFITPEQLTTQIKRDNFTPDNVYLYGIYREKGLLSCK